MTRLKYPNSINLLTLQTQGSYDVVVVGSGMAGACLAATLGSVYGLLLIYLLGSSPLSKGLKIAVIDSVPPEGLPEQLPELPDIRVFSINPASIGLFKGTTPFVSLTGSHWCVGQDASSSSHALPHHERVGWCRKR